MQEVEWRGQVFQFSDNATEDQIKNFLRKEKAKTEYDGTNLARQFAQGATFNFSDEIEAGVRAPFSDATYQDIVTDVRKQQDVFAKENPGAAIAANLLGGITTPGLGVAAGLSKALPKIGTLGKTILAGAGTGTLSGLGAGEGLGDSIDQAAIGGITGAALGPAVSYGAKGIGLGASNLSSAVTNLFSGEKSKFLRSTAQKLADDGLSIDQIKARLRTLGPNASIIDVGGPNISGMAEAAAQQPGKANNRAQQFLKGRLRLQRDRIGNLVRENISENPDFLEESAANLAKKYDAKAKPLYEMAYKADIANHSELKPFYDNPLLKPYIEKAETTMLGDVRIPDDVKLRQVEVDEEGARKVLPNLAQLDHVQQSLYDDIRKAQRDGKANEAARLTALRSSLLQKLDDPAVNPFYKNARNVWKNGQESLDALNLGVDIFKDASKYGTKELNKVVSQMTPADKELFKLGAANQMIRIVEKSADDLDGNAKLTLVNQLFGSPEKRNAVKTIFGEDVDGFRRFKRNIIAEKKFRSTAGKILANSATFRRQAFSEVEGPDVSAAADTASALRGNVSGIAGLVKRVTNNLSGRRELNDEISRRFFTNDLNEIQNTLEDLQKQGNLLPNWAVSLTTQEKLKTFLKNPKNSQKLMTFISGATGAQVGDAGYEPTVIPITRGRNE